MKALLNRQHTIHDIIKNWDLTAPCFNLTGQCSAKQGYALKNWMEGFSDEVYYPGVTKKFFD